MNKLDLIEAIITSYYITPQKLIGGDYFDVYRLEVIYILLWENRLMITFAL